MSIAHRILDTGAREFAIRDRGGAGRGLLLVHGTGHNLEVWEPVAQRLSDDFRVVSVDLRGHGQTRMDSADAEDYWRDLADIIAALGLVQPILVGHSGGGYAVTAHAASGGVCAGLVIVDGFVLDTREAALRSTGVVSREQLWDKFRYGWVASDKDKEAWVKQVRDEARGDSLNAGIDPDLVEGFTRRSFVRHGDGWLRRPTLEEVDRLMSLDERRAILPARDIYERLTVPVNFIFAQRGLYRERGEEVRRLAAKIGARLVELNAGHNVHMQQPAEVGAVIRDFACRL